MSPPKYFVCACDKVVTNANANNIMVRFIDAKVKKNLLTAK